MDWLVSSLETTQQAKLPMWLLLTQIYARDLLALRRNGRRLIHALLSHHLTVRPDRCPLAVRLAFGV